MAEQTKYSRDMSKALYSYMREREITHQAVADYLKKSRDYVSKRLRAEAPLSVDIICAVADLTRISPRALFQELLERSAP